MLKTIKELVIRKMDLLDRKDDLKSTILKGRDFFHKHIDNGEMLASGTERLIEVIDEINAIDDEIKNLDILIVSSLELKDFDFKLNLPQRVNGTGDIINSQEVIVSESGNGISVDDIWTVILLKEMFEVKNIEVIKKGE